MEEELQPKGATIVKDLLEATVRLVVSGACLILAVKRCTPQTMHC